MKILQSAKVKAHFSSILRDVQAGNEIGIAYGKSKQTIAVITSYEKWKKSQKRQLGILEGKASVHFAEDFKMTDEELLNS
jgi:antitoxin (DNA-binding transcriptional repressor) of toxin-antitoxin stability system